MNWIHFSKDHQPIIDKELPILEKLSKETKCVYSVEDIARLLLNLKLKSSKFVANKVITMICSSVPFVVNVDSLDAKEDLMSDDMGTIVLTGLTLK